MKSKYGPTKIMAHAGMYVLSLVVPHRKSQWLWRIVLRHRNSIPLYLVVASGDTVVQVGTPNVHTLRRYARQVGKNGKVVIIEADRENAERLHRAAEKFANREVYIVCKGAWSSKGFANFIRSEEYDGDHRIENDDVVMDNDFRSSSTSTGRIEVDTVDNILGELGLHSVDYLCVTVNGAELEVLKGAHVTLSRAKGMQVFSKGHARLGAAESSDTLAEHVLALLSEYGFESTISKGEKSSSGVDHWRVRGGDVFGWK